jgi:HSP20 family molecular chaperone IbpA
MKQEEYSIIAKRGDQEFREAIALPPEVDIGKVSEHFRNGVLEIVLIPR